MVRRRRGHAFYDLSALTDLVDIMLRGEVPQFVVLILYCVNECGIEKKNGAIRPIAIGITIRRLEVKVGSRPVAQALGEELRPVQLGVATSRGCEVAAYATRRYARDCRYRRVLLKIDMRNPFNSLRRDSFLSVAHIRTPGFYSLLWQAYSSPTRLFFGEEFFSSETGIPQRNPIGPAFFALTVDEATRDAQPEFNAWSSQSTYAWLAFGLIRWLSSMVTNVL